MRNPLTILKQRLSRKSETQPVLPSDQEEALKASVDQVLKPAKRPSQGKIVRSKRPEYNPAISGHGGRIVKAMPRELQKIKEAQEKTDDDLPNVED